MNVAIALAVFPVIFLGELPDKTMFASLVLASRGRPFLVWCGAALAFTVHVAIAVAAGGLLAQISHRLVDAIVAVLFLLGAGFALRDSGEAEAEKGVDATHVLSARRTMATAFGVIFLAEWGDLTQILTASLAARYGAPLSVSVGAVAALLAVSALAVTAGRLLSRVPMTLVRRITAVVLLALAGVSIAGAVGA